MAETVKDKVKNTRRWISWSLGSTFSGFISTNSNFYCSKKVLVEEGLEEQEENI